MISPTDNVLGVRYALTKWTYCVEMTADPARARVARGVQNTS